MKKIHIILSVAILILMIYVPCMYVNAEGEEPDVNYSVHGQNYGWQEYVSDGDIAGTTGQSKRLESLIINLNNLGDKTGDITYRVHQQTYGWSDWVAGGQEAGVIGQSKRLEAVEFNLSGDIASYYDIYYCVHQQGYGWSGWVKNGGTAGVTGESKRLEAIMIKLIPIGGTIVDEKPSLTYQSQVQTYGWLDTVGEGIISGTTGQSKRLETLKINLTNPDGNGDIIYRAHVQGIGWQDYVSSGGTTGTEGQSKRLEAIQINLTGKLADLYDVYYRIHVQKYGWSGWAKNGATAGTMGICARTEAMQITLVSKGQAAPGSTANACRTLDSVGGYSIEVNKEACCVTVYAGLIPVKAMICSPGTGTPTGTFSTTDKYRWRALVGGVQGQFCTRIVRNILFHSVPYSSANNRALLTEEYNKLGTQASHGCIRLTVEDCKWLYDNCPSGTTVVIYNSSNPGPLGRPGSAILPAGQTWDPTDPTL